MKILKPPQRAHRIARPANLPPHDHPADGEQQRAQDTTSRWLRTKQTIRRMEREYHRPPGSVRLLAASKGRTSGELLALLRAGQVDFGENYLQEALPKITALARGAGSGSGACSPVLPVWHFIGAVQSNKTRLIARHFSWVHGVDRERIACRLSAARPPELPALNICIQINISAEPTKAGLDAGQLPGLVARVRDLPGLRLRGLMALPAPAHDFSRQCAAFRQLRDHFEQLRSQGLAPDDWDSLSMGTSADMRAAIASGSTLLRLGTALFGPRSQSGPRRR